MFWLVLASTNCKLQNRILYVMLCWVVLLIPWVNFMMNSGKCISSIYMVLGIKTKCWRWASISMAPTPSPVPPSPIWLAPSPTPKMPKIKIKRSPKMLWFLTVILHECLTMLQAAVRVKILFWHRCSLVLNCASPRDLWAKKADLLPKDSGGFGYGSGLVQKL